MTIAVIGENKFPKVETDVKLTANGAPVYPCGFHLSPLIAIHP
jgi:hypothetical protein